MVHFIEFDFTKGRGNDVYYNSLCGANSVGNNDTFTKEVKNTTCVQCSMLHKAIMDKLEDRIKNLLFNG